MGQHDQAKSPAASPTASATPSHDARYRALFSDPLMMADLLKAFVPSDTINQLDLSSLVMLNGAHVSESGARRDSDCVWRINGPQGATYLYVLLEFQRRSERFMALRVLVYVGLLLQQLLRERRASVTPSESTRDPSSPRKNPSSPNTEIKAPVGGMPLPPVLPLVLYNGARRWKAPTDLSALRPTLPLALQPFQPQQRYVLIDEGAYADDWLSALRGNVAAAVFRLERPQPLSTVQEVVTDLERSTRGAQWRSLRRLLARWIGALLRPPDLPSDAEPWPEFDDLQELERSMQENHWTRWRREFRQEGRLEGRLEGQLEGRQEGQRALLTRLLERRFGPLPDWAAARVQQASSQELEHWTDQLLDATTLEAILGPQLH